MELKRHNRYIAVIAFLFTVASKNNVRVYGLSSPLSDITNNLKGSSFLVTRQQIFGKMLAIGVASATVAVTPRKVLAENESEMAVNGGEKGSTSIVAPRPFAPTEALLPATRLKVWTEKADEISKSLPSNDEEQRYQIVLKLNTFLSSPPKLFLSEKLQKRTSGSTAQITSAVSNANKDQYQMTRKDFNVGDKFAAMLNQADVERQWGMLQYAESKREQSNEMRAAFNFYTQQLSFGDKYNLTASKEDRKRMIRNDKLPSLTAVITSDLDLRDLYRNNFLTAIEDVQAEVAYQAKQKPQEIDTVDIEDLMSQASNALSKWFDLISAEDVQEARAAVCSK